jgi:hypothetical protein
VNGRAEQFVIVHDYVSGRVIPDRWLDMVAAEQNEGEGVGSGDRMGVGTFQVEGNRPVRTHLDR